MEQRVSLITLGVADLGRARAFYEALGWKTGAAPDDDVVFFQAGGMIVALWSREQLAADTGIPDDGGWGGITLAHNERSPAAVDAVLAEASTAGANATKHARIQADIPDGRWNALMTLHFRRGRWLSALIGGLWKVHRPQNKTVFARKPCASLATF